MRKIGIFGVFILWMFMLACEPSVVFGEPQPSGVRPLSEVPKDYRGVYWCRVDSASLFVDNHAFIRRKEILVKLTEAEISESPELVLHENALYVQDWEQSFPIEKKGDTIVSALVVLDTIFSIGEQDILKPLKGHLVMNKKIDENAWMILVASLRPEGTLAISRAELPEDLSQLEKITDVKTTASDNDRVTQIFITPTQEQFETILQKKILFEGNCTEFERVIPVSIPN